MPADSLVSADTLALVRFGLRAPDDPRIVDSVRVIDHVLQTELPTGPGWRRYNGDGYGEHEDGSPFNGTGMGRVWPLLAGERAHYELAAGHKADAEHLLAVMEATASPGGLLPEQVWDGPPTARAGAAAGQAQRLAPCRWSGRMPSISSCCARWRTPRCSTCRRSRCGGTSASIGSRASQPWRPDWRTETVAPGRVLRLDLPEPRWWRGARIAGARVPRY